MMSMPDGLSGAAFLRAAPAFPPCVPLTWRMSQVRTPDTCKSFAGYIPLCIPIQNSFLPDTFTIRTCLFPYTCSFVRAYPPSPAYVSYRRSASYATAGGWLRPLDPRKGKRREIGKKGKAGVYRASICSASISADGEGRHSRPPAPSLQYSAHERCPYAAYP